MSRIRGQPRISSLPATNALRLRWERSDEAIQLCRSKLDCFAALAMTRLGAFVVTLV
jgi:hypothetical protein